MIVYTGDGQALNTVVIAGNHFIENESSVNGGALALSTGHHTVRDNVFVRNSCKFDGGAIWAFQPTSLTLIGNQFWENVAGDHGGAMEIGQPRTDAQCLVEGNLLVRNRAMNLDSASGNGAGGALSFRPGRGLVTRNTFVGNEGTGPLACSAGDILIWSPSGSTVEIVRNIFSKSRTCAISCMHPDGLLRGNIFWQNTPGDVWDDGGCFPGWEEDNLLVDPKFCDPLTDNFTVSKDSPALGEFGPIGAFTNPGCGEGVAVDPTSWGRIKVRYVD
jgi:hypothetical protein